MKVFVKSVVLALVLLGLERTDFAAAAVEGKLLSSIIYLPSKVFDIVE